MQHLDRLGWAASSTFEIGIWHIGVRSNTEEADLLLRRALQDYVVPEGAAPPNYSMVLAANGEDRTSKLNVLYKSHSQIVRSRRPSRAMLGLLEHLAEFAREEPVDALEIAAVALIRDSKVTIVPPSITVWLDQLAPRLYRKGFQFADASLLYIDVSSGDLVLPNSPFPLDQSFQDELTRLDAGARGLEREPEPVHPGRYKIVSWGFFGDEKEFGPLSAAKGMLLAAPGIRNHRSLGTRTVIGALRKAFATTTAFAIGSPYEDDLASKLVAFS